MSHGELPQFDSQWDFDDPAASEARFRALQPLAEAAADRAYAAQLLTQIARAQGLQRKFDRAHATLEQATQALEAQDLPADAVPLVRTRCLLERGRVFNSSGEAEKARPYFEQALEIALAGKLDPLAIDAAHMLAIIEPHPQRQLQWNLRAFELAENSSDERARRWRASLCNNLGWTHFEQKDYVQALGVFEKAVELRREQNQPRELRIARYCVAKTLRMQGQIERAAQINRQIVEESEAAAEPDGYFHEELAECLLAAGQIEQSKLHFRRAYERLSQDPWIVQSESPRLERLKRLSEA